MTVGHFMVESTGTLSELDRVQLSGRVPGHNGVIAWAGNSLAILTGDFSVRIWDIDTSDNYLLPTELKLTSQLKPIPKIKHPSMMQSDDDISGSVKNRRMEVFTCIAYSLENQTLCAGTNHGNLYAWKYTGRITEQSENGWQLNNKCSNVRGAIKDCSWGVCENSRPCILLNCVANVYILKVCILILNINEQCVMFFSLQFCAGTTVAIHAYQRHMGHPTFSYTSVYRACQRKICFSAK